jgi:hypothetical protein
MRVQPLISGNVRVDGRVLHYTRALQMGVSNSVILEAALLHFRAMIGCEGIKVEQRVGKRKRLPWTYKRSKV